MKSNFYNFKEKETLLNALSKKIGEKLNEAILEKGYASLVVSGGNTPKPLFKKLSNLKLEWEKVTITLTDERWTDIKSQDSNENMVRENLLQNEAKNAKFIGLKTSHKNAFEAQKTLAQKISTISKPFDLILLGMGEDAHTASLFPDAKELKSALYDDISLKAITPPNAPFERITLTLKTLLDAKSIILYIEGDKKYRVYKDVIESELDEKKPIGFILKQQKTPVEVYHT